MTAMTEIEVRTTTLINLINSHYNTFNWYLDHITGVHGKKREKVLLKFWIKNNLQKQNNSKMG